MEYASSDIRFDVPLAEACFEDRQEFCANVPPGSARVIRCLQDRHVPNLACILSGMRLTRRESLLPPRFFLKACRDVARSAYPDAHQDICAALIPCWVHNA